MATQRTISTISYNSESFLKEKLDNLIKAHTLAAYVYIKHLGEDGDKDHIHLLVYPNKRIDPMDLSDLLKEYVLGNSKPLGVLNWRTSDEYNWFLYAVHNPDFMRLKYGESDKEKLPYTLDDFVCSDDFPLENTFTRAQATLNHSNASILKSLRSGKTAFDLVSQGENVFVVNALNKALYETEFNAVVKERDTLRKYYEQICCLLAEKNISVQTDDDDNIFLEMGCFDDK